MGNIFYTFICLPFGAILRWIYFLVKSYGFAIILFTIVTKIIFMPLSIKSKRSMISIQKLSPKLTELQKKFGNDKEGYNRAASELFQSENVSPMGGCLPTLITFPIMIGLYYVIQRPLSFFFGLTYDKIVTIATALGEVIPESTAKFYQMEISLASKAMENFDKIKPIASELFHVNFNFLGMPLAEIPQWNKISLLWIIPVLSGLTAFISNKVMMKMQEKTTGGQNPMAGQSAFITLLMPLMSIWFGFILPAGIGVYWITSNIAMMLQEIWITNYLLKEEHDKQIIIEAEKEAREAAKREIERERREELLKNQTQSNPNTSNKKKKNKKKS